MHEVLVNRLGGLSLPRKSVVRLTDRPDMTLDVHRERKTRIQQQQLTWLLYNFQVRPKYLQCVAISCLYIAAKTLEEDEVSGNFYNTVFIRL